MTKIIQEVLDAAFDRFIAEYGYDCDLDDYTCFLGDIGGGNVGRGGAVELTEEETAYLDNRFMTRR